MSNDFNDLPSWLRGDDEEEKKTPSQPEPEDTPDAEGDQIPDWLKSPGASTSQPETEDEDEEFDLPPWMMDAEPVQREVNNLNDDLASFLANADALPDTFQSELTYDEWMAQQERERRGLDPEEEVPEDFFAGLEELPATGQAKTPGTTDVPDWFLGLEELDESDVPDWMVDQAPAQQPVESELPPWMADVEVPAATPTPAAPAGEFDDDFLKELGLDNSEETPDEEDLFAAFGLTEDTPAAAAQLEDDEDFVPDWMQSETAEETPDEEDLFAAFGLTENPPTAQTEEDTPDWMQQSAQGEEIPAEDDFFASFGMTEAQAEETPAEDDFFAAFGATDAQQPAAAQADDDEFAWMSEEEEAETPAAPAIPTAQDETDAMLAALGMTRQEPQTEEEPFDVSWLMEDDQPAPTVTPTPVNEEEFAFPWDDEEEEEPPVEMPTLGIRPKPAPPAEPAATPNFDDDFLSQMFGFEEEEAAPEAAQAEPTAARTDDPFAEFDFDTTLRDDASPDWLSTLGDIEPMEEETPPAPPAPAVPAAALPADDDWLSEMQVEDEFVQRKLPNTSDLESFLASLDEEQLPQTEGLSTPDNFDIDSLFTDVSFPEPEPEPSRPSGPTTTDEIAPAMPDFLQDLQASVGQVSAAAMVRGRKDRPLEELPDRLRQLHEKAEDLPRQQQPAFESDTLANVLPGITDTLLPAQIKTGLPTAGGTVSLSEDQRRKMDILRSMLAADDNAPAQPPNQLSAIDLTYDTPNLDDEDDLFGLITEEEAAPAPAETPKQVIISEASKPRRRKRTLHLDRLVVAAALAAAMAAPFFIPALRVGDLPPVAFAQGSRGEAAFNRVESLERGDLVLVAVEYGPTAAAELDGLTASLLRHILLQEARPVIVSTNPVGLLHAANVIEALNNDPAFVSEFGRPLQENSDYFTVRFLSGNIIGIRALAINPQDMLLNDIRGRATGLNIGSMNDFALVTVIAERSEEIRAYAEQVAPMTASPLVLATNFAAAPLAEPYANVSGIEGLLIGYRDAYTYSAILRGDLPPVVPTLPPATETPTDEATPEATIEPAAEITETVEATEVPPTATVRATTETPTEVATEAETEAAPVIAATETPAATSTVRPTNTEAGPTEQATNTPNPTASPTAASTSTPTLSPTPTATATQAATATATPFPGITGIVTSTQTVNIRSGPGTSYSAIEAIPPGTRVEVLGRDSNNTWYRIRIPGGNVEGWIFAQLLRIEESDQSEPIPEETESASKLSPFLRPAAQGEEEATETPGDQPNLIQGIFGGLRQVLPPPSGSSEPTTQTDDEANNSAETVTDDVAEAPAAATLSSDPNPVVALPTDRYRDERWYAMTLGIITSATMITLGTVVNIARSLSRRRRR